MESYNIGLVVEVVDLTEADIDLLLGALPDAVLACVDRVVTITTPFDGAGARQAALGLAASIRRVVPRAVPMRVDQDLVSVSDIASRVERSRESVRLLVEGRRGPGGFPAPVGMVGDGIRVWPWSTVVAWFDQHLDAGLDERLISPLEAAEVDIDLAARAGRSAAAARRPVVQRFVVQVHDATRLHFDVRIESGGVLRSWAVPRGPSMDPGVRRLAVQVDDHDLAAGEFEGVRGGQRRGTGAVIIWDEGTVDLVREELDRLTFVLDGRKLAGRFELVRTGGTQWILVKGADDEARRGSDVARDQPESVRSGRTWQEVAATADPS